MFQNDNSEFQMAFFERLSLCSRYQKDWMKQPLRLEEGNQLTAVTGDRWSVMATTSNGNT